MKSEYDFSNGRRGRIVPPEPERAGKRNISIWLDGGVLDHFFEMAEQSGGSVSYETLINSALVEYLDGQAPKFEDALRRIIREELKGNAA
jgi:hypothetical protein